MTIQTRRDVLVGASALAAAGVADGLVWWRGHRSERGFDYSSPEFHGRAATVAELKGRAAFDVCIVGSGPAGTALGTQLAAAGVRTLILEAGMNPSHMAKEARFERLNLATVSGNRTYPLTATRAMMPGGTTALWTGNTPRLLPIDFETNAYTPAGTAWPIDYATIDPYYERAEALLGVSGESNVRYAPPRHHPLPHEHRGGNRLVKKLLARAEVHAFDTFKSHAPVGYGPIRVARDLLPQFVRHSSAVFVPSLTARRFIGSSPQQIAGVQVADIGGEQHIVQARAYVLAAGAVETARRLLLSRSEYFPTGIGNASDQVGRTFADHLHYNFTGRLAARNVPGQDSLPQVVRSYQYYEMFKRRGLGSVAVVASLRNTDSEDLEFRITGACELEPVADNRVTLDESVHDLWGDPVAHLHFAGSEKDRLTEIALRALVLGLYQRLGAEQVTELPYHWGHHHLGIVRMGRNPRTSVVDENLRVHGVSNLYAITSGNFVTSGPANPTLLIVALAHRLGDHLLARLREGALPHQSLQRLS